MSMTWVSGSPMQLSATLRARGAGGAKVVSAVMEDVIEEAADRMVQTIETTPSGLKPGKIGRVWTGNMRDTVETRPVTSGGGKVTGEWGWFSPEAYIDYQEKGAAMGRATIPPMHALLGSFLWARIELQLRLNALMKRM